MEVDGSHVQCPICWKDNAFDAKKPLISFVVMDFYYLVDNGKKRIDKYKMLNKEEKVYNNYFLFCYAHISLQAHRSSTREPVSFCPLGSYYTDAYF